MLVRVESDVKEFIKYDLAEAEKKKGIIHKSEENPTQSNYVYPDPTVEVAYTNH